MFPARKSVGRFSLLLLDENEFYIRDYLANCTWPADVSGNVLAATQLPGQLRLCTKSLFFEPDDIRIPIVRLPFQHLQQLEGIGRQEISAVAERLSKMKINASDEPYVFEKGKSSPWVFKLEYAVLSDFMPLAQRMLVASRMSQPDQDVMLAEVMAEVEGSLRFDPGHLKNPSTETILLEIAAMRLDPLIKESCRLALTNAFLYIQPLHNINGDAAVLSYPLSSIAAVARRRSALKDVGMEVFFVDSSSQFTAGKSSTFFSFKSQEERNLVVDSISSQPNLGKDLVTSSNSSHKIAHVLEASGGWLPRVTAAWQHGKLSNFEYLLYCNLAAGRSFHDISQYPVFPWVIQDYVSDEIDLNDPGAYRDLSRPIGALNLPRLAQFLERYREMESDASRGYGDPPFMYGTHYSCPGYTLFWLVRAAPGRMLRLQNGRFDAPDRLFSSISEAWDSVMTNPADVKELIPEFYMPDRPEFLVNSRRLALGVRQDGRHVGDVVLPPWAKSSPKRFLSIQRAALESPFVSANLHHWIDLIFGAKQRGRAAVDACNVYRHLTYEGAIDPESITDSVQRQAVEVAINEFGQCPRQIFHNPHPSRFVCPPPPPLAQDDDFLDTDNTIFASSSSLSSPSSFSTSLSLSPQVSDGKMNTNHNNGIGTISPATSHQIVSSIGAPTKQSLSLSLVSSIIATLDVEGEDHSQIHHQDVQVPPLLKELDVLGQQQQPCTTTLQRNNTSKNSMKNDDNGGDGTVAEKSAVATPVVSTPEGKRSIHNKISYASSFASAAAGISGTWTALKGTLPTLASSGKSASDRFISGFLASNLTNRWATSSSPHEGAKEKPLEEKDYTDNGSSPISEEPLSAPPPAIVYKTAKKSPENYSNQTKEIEEYHGSWGMQLRDRLSPGRVLMVGAEAINALDLSFFSDHSHSPCVFTACHDGTIRITNVLTGAQSRSVHVGTDQPLTSLALLHPSPLSKTSPRMYHSNNANPTVLCGSYDGNVYAYNPSAGNILGNFPSHVDAVSCIALDTTSTKLATTSWDCTFKLWSLEEGRMPWESTLSQPIAYAGDLPGGVWSLALPQGENTGWDELALVGTEEGHAVLLDLRSSPYNNSNIIWDQELGQDYIGGLSLLPNGWYALAACADGTLSLLDTRRSGDVMSSVSCGTSLRCCLCDGSTALVGGESGSIYVWDVDQQLQRPPPPGHVIRTAPGLDGLYSPIHATPSSPVSSIAVNTRLRDSDGQEKLCFASGHDGGVVRVYWT